MHFGRLCTLSVLLVVTVSRACPTPFTCTHTAVHPRLVPSCTHPNPHTPCSCLVIIDFLIRHGYITPEMPGYLQLVTGLRSGDCS